MDVQEADDTEDAFRKAEELFHPAEDLEFEIYKFRPAKQLPGENISANFTRLKKYCEFHDERREIKIQIAQNSCLSKLRRKALADPEIMLEKLIQIAKSMETPEVQAAINSKRKPAAVKLIKIGTKANRKPNESLVVFNMFWAKIIALPMESNVVDVRNGIISRPFATRKEKGRSETNSRNSRSEASNRNRSRLVNNLNTSKVESSSEDEYVFSTSAVSAMLHQKLPKFKVNQWDYN